MVGFIVIRSLNDARLYPVAALVVAKLILHALFQRLIHLKVCLIQV